MPDGDGGWEAPVKVLPEIMKPHSGELSIVLADQFVRYVLLPWNETLKSGEQWLALAKHRFAGLHGAARAAEWEVKVSETAPAGARLACAVDKALIDALKKQFLSSEIHLASVQPFLVAAFNRIRAELAVTTVVMDMNRAEDIAAWLSDEGLVVIDRAQTNKPQVEDYERFMAALRGGVLFHSGDRWYWSTEKFPADEISLRSASIDNFVIVDESEVGRPRVIGEMDLDATLSGRERINSSLLTILDGATEPWGVKVSRVELRKVEPPDNLVRAMNLQMTAERERRAAGDLPL